MEDLRDILDNLEKIKNEFKEDLNFLAIFGSRAKGTFKRDSDLDLFYDMENVDRLIEFEEYVDKLFEGMKIDLVPILSVLHEEQDLVADYFMEGSILIHESKRLYNYLKNERILNRYKKYFN